MFLMILLFIFIPFTLSSFADYLRFVRIESENKKITVVILLAVDGRKLDIETSSSQHHLTWV